MVTGCSYRVFRGKGQGGRRASWRAGHHDRYDPYARFPLCPKSTIWEAASSDSRQAFLLVGTLLPIILTYSGRSYWVFRGEARADIGYH